MQKAHKSATTIRRKKKSMIRRITPTLKNITTYMPHKFQFRSYVKQFSYALCFTVFKKFWLLIFVRKNYAIYKYFFCVLLSLIFLLQFKMKTPTTTTTIITMNGISSLNVRILLLIRDPRGFLQSRKHRVWCPGNADCKSDDSYLKMSIHFVFISLLSRW